MATPSHALPGPPPRDSAARDEAAAGSVPWSFAWFSGADLNVLARVPSEQTFYRRLGVGVLLISCASGIAFSSALAYALDTSFASMIWAGVFWTLLLACGVEPLVLQISPTRRWPVLAAGIAWRVLFSVLLAFQLSEPLILRLNEPEINRQLHDERGLEIRKEVAANNATFNPTITEAHDEIHTMKAGIAKTDAEADELRRERDLALETGRCDAECQHHGQRLEAKEAHLRELEQLQAKREPKLEEEIDRFQTQGAKNLKEGKDTIDERNGLWARIGALEAVASSSGAKQGEVWALRLLCLWLDLLPLAAKVYRIFTVESPYEMHLAAARHEETISAQAKEAVTGVNEEMIREQARADTEVGRAEIHVDTERRLAETLGTADGSVASGFPSTGPAVSAWKLSNYVREMKTHDTQPVPVPAELRRGALAGAAATAAVAVVATLWTAVSGHAVGGLWLLVLALVAIGSLAAYTHGFRRAPAWALRAILATFIGGFLLPFGVILSNLF